MRHINNYHIINLILICMKFKPLLHDQIFFDKFHVLNGFLPCKCGSYDKFILNTHLTQKICQRKFVRVQGALQHVSLIL